MYIFQTIHKRTSVFDISHINLLQLTFYKVYTAYSKKDNIILVIGSSDCFKNITHDLKA